MPDILPTLFQALTLQTLALMLVTFIAGLCVPFDYGIERLRGFGRAVLSRLPYQPPETETARGKQK